jgi:signal transduction histidine kinase
MAVKCLIVDDLEDNLLALSSLLRRDDVEVIAARSGAEALDKLLMDANVALALVDVQMPEMDGFELAEFMRGSERTRHIPIIFATAASRDQHRLFKGYEAGAVDFLYKPLDPFILKNKADVFFELYRQKQRLARELHDRTEMLRLQETFAAVLGHDLRTPLGAIVTGAQLLQHRHEDEAVKRIAGRMLSSGLRMTRMIEDLLDLTRARLAGGIPIVRVPGDLGTIVERVVQEQQAAFPNRSVEFTRQGNLAGSWDTARLGQLSSNLIGNALQHGAEGQPVRVVVDGADSDAVGISVSNGGSIPQGIVPHLFDPFRGAERQQGRLDGLGLGLYIAQQIARAHEGAVNVDLGVPGEVTFAVRIPRVAAAAVRF